MSPLKKAVANAKTILNAHKLQKAIGAYFVKKVPSLDGTIYDELEGLGDAREIVGGRGASLDGVNQSFIHTPTGGVHKGDENFTVFLDLVRTNSATTGSDKYINSMSIGSQNGWRIMRNGTSYRVQWYNTGGAVNTLAGSLSDISTTKSTQIGCRFTKNGSTWDIDVIVNGRVTHSATGQDYEPSNSNTISVGKTDGSSSDYLDGEVIESLYFGSSLSKAEIRDVYRNIHKLTEDDLGWRYDTDQAWGLTANSPNVTGGNSPTLYESADIRISQYDYNRAGFSYKRLETNGSFDSDVSSWTGVAGTLSHENGKAKISYDSTAANVGLYQAITKPSNKIRVKADIEIVSGGLESGEFEVRNRYGTRAKTGLTGTGSIDVEVEVNGATSDIEIFCYASDIVFTVDNVEIIDEQVRVSARIDGGDSQGNSLTFNGIAPWNWKLEGASCIEGDGVNQYGTSDSSANVQFGDGSSDDPFAVYCEFNVDAFAAGKGGLVSKITDVDSGNCEWSLLLNDSGDLVFILYDDTNSNSIKIETDSPLSTSKNYKVLATYDGGGAESGLSLYVDDGDGWTTPAATKSETGTYVAMHATTTPVEVGAHISGNTSYDRYVDGKIWNVRIYDSEISTSQLETANIVRYWPDASGYDVSGSGKHLTWQNGPTESTQNQFFYNAVKGFTRKGKEADGTDDTLATPSVITAIIDPEKNFSMRFRCNVRTPAPNNACLFSHTHSGGDVRFSVNIESGQIRLQCDYGPSAVGKASTNFAYDKDFEVAIIWDFDSKTLRLFTNGVEQTATNAAQANLTNGSYIMAPATGADWGSIRLAKGEFWDLEAWDSTLADHAAFDSTPSTERLRLCETGDEVKTDSGVSATWNGTPSNGDIIPALNDGSADAFGGQITVKGGNPLFLPGGETINRSPVSNCQIAKYAGQRVVGNGTDAEIDYGINLLNGTDWEWEARVIIPSGASANYLWGSATLWGLLADTSQDRFRMRFGSTNEGVNQHSSPSSSLVEGSEHHLKVKRDGNDISFFIDGTETTATLSAPGTNSGDIAIFSRNGGYYMNAKIRNLKMTVSGAVVFDSPMTFDSLDLNSSVNHGDDNANITRDFLDLSSNLSFGSSTEFPLSIVQDVQNEKEIIIFGIGV